MIAIADNIKKIKPFLSYLLIILLFLSFGILTIKGLFTLGTLTRAIYEHPLVVSNASLNAALSITKMHRSMKDVVLTASPKELETALKAVSEAEQNVFQQLDIIQKNVLGEKGQTLEQEARKLFVNWKPIRAEVVQLLKLDDKATAILITKGKGADHVAKLESKMMELKSYARDKATSFIEIAEQGQSILENITVFLTFSGVILSLIIAIIASSRLQNAKNKINDKNNKLQKALDEVKTLRGILPICSYCKKIRDDSGAWERFEAYIYNHSEAQFSHGLCPECYQKEIESLSKDQKK